MTNNPLPAERIERIRQLLRERQVVKVEELCGELGASPATVRRDLADLDSRGYLHRVHGGAVCVEGRRDEPGFEDKTSIAAKEKQHIAEAAAKRIQPSDCIFLDGGSTVLALAHLLTDMTRLTVVTNSLKVAGLFAVSGPKTILVGGELRRLSQTFVGPLTQPMIETLHLDAAFMGTIGLTPEEGMTTTVSGEAMTKRLVMRRAQQVVLLADSSKIGKVSFVKAGDVTDISTLITDRNLPDKEAKAFRKRGVKVIKA